MTVESLKKTEKLIELAHERFCGEELDLIKQARAFAEEHYAEVNHPLDKPYIQYISEVVTILDGLLVDAVTIAAAIIYPPPSVREKVLVDLRKEFSSSFELLKLIEDLLSLCYLEGDLWPTAPEQNEPKERKEILRKVFLLAIDEMKSEDQEQMAVPFQKREKQLENLIRMLLASATDARALIIKLADRLYFMKLLRDLPPNQRGSIQYVLFAKLTIAIYASLADRLGMWQLKSQLEDESFHFLQPERYKAIADLLADKKREGEDYINNLIIPAFKDVLEKFDIKAEIVGRAKHIYSIHQKMEAKQLEFEQINDLLGIRIIVDAGEDYDVLGTRDCYGAQDIIHAFWSPITIFYGGEPGRDWIAKPKENQYQSLHTTVCFNDKMVEVQIRTRKMHEIAEHGLAAAHWQYKGSKAYRKGKTPRVTKEKDQVLSNQLARLRKSRAEKQEQEKQKQAKKQEQGGKQKQEPRLKSWIFVITPKGHVLEFPAGATPLDFAYRIHTTFGHGYGGAKVNGRLVHLDYKLKNGDIVELFGSRPKKIPSRDWLSQEKDEQGNPHYVFARTYQARSKIRNGLKKQER